VQNRSGEERREFQRLALDPPIPGSLGATAISILEIGVLGARVHHGEPLDAERGDLRFAFEGKEIGLQCQVVRSVPSRDAKYPGSGIESGLRFVAAIGNSGDVLREMLARLVLQELERSRAGNGTPLPAPEIDGDKTVRGIEAGFSCYRLENGCWSRRPVFLPEQPASGFTVARGQDAEEMQRLCLVYAASDDEGRRLIRLFAELSVSDALQIPPRAT
jgi:hypothetical protein